MKSKTKTQLFKENQKLALLRAKLKKVKNSKKSKERKKNRGSGFLTSKLKDIFIFPIILICSMLVF